MRQSMLIRDAACPLAALNDLIAGEGIEILPIEVIGIRPTASESHLGDLPLQPFRTRLVYGKGAGTEDMSEYLTLLQKV